MHGETHITIRHAQPDDVAALRELHAASLRRLAAPHYGTDAIEAFIAHGTLPEELIPQRRYFVAAAEGRLLGCGGWSAVPPRYAALLPDGYRATPPVVRAVNVHPDVTRRGIGRALNALDRAGDARGRLRPRLPARHPVRFAALPPHRLARR